MNTPAVAILVATILFFAALFGVFSVASPALALVGLLATVVVLPAGLMVTLFRMA